MTELPDHPTKIAFIIEKFALRWDISRIKESYQQYFEEKINPVTLLELRSKFTKQIKEQEEIELKDISRRGPSHPAIRLDYIQMGIDYALKRRPVKSVKVSETEYEVFYDIDHQALAKYLDLAQKEEYMAKRLLVEILKNEIESPIPKRSSFEPVKIEDGLRFD